MQIIPSHKENHMSKSIAVRRPSTTTKWLIGLTVFFVICKTLSNR